MRGTFCITQLLGLYAVCVWNNSLIVGRARSRGCSPGGTSGLCSVDSTEVTIVRIAPASRLLVLWVGGEVPEAARLAFESRGVAIEASVPDGLEEQAALSAVTAAFFIQSATKPLRILPMIAAHAPRLLNYDSRVFVLATPNGIGNVVRCLMRGRIPALWASRTGQDSEVFNGRRIVRLSIGGEQPLPHVRVHPHNVPMATVPNFVLKHPSVP